MPIMSASFSSSSPDVRNALHLSLLLTVVLSLTIGILVLRVDPVRASWFSDLFKMAVDLGQCAMSFSRPMIAGTLLALVAGTISMVRLALCLADLYTARQHLRPHGILLVGIAGLATTLLQPAISGEATWRGSTSLDAACPNSHNIAPYRVFADLASYAFLAWLALFAGALLKERISANPARAGLPTARQRLYGRPPTPVVRDDIIERVPMVVRVVFLLLAAFAIIWIGSSLKFSVLRLYHQFTWIERPATIVELNFVCAFQMREGRNWIGTAQSDCTQPSQRQLLLDFVGQDPHRRRMTITPQAMLELEMPQGGRMYSDVKGYFFLPPTPTEGERFVLLGDPSNPGKLDRTFDIQDAGKTFGRLLLVAMAMIAIYLIWPHIGRRRA